MKLHSKILAFALAIGTWLCGALAMAADRVTATLTITNIPAAAQALVVNGDTRTWIGSVTVPASQVATNATAWGSATNLWTQIVSYGFTGPVLPAWGSTNQISLAGSVGQSMAVSATGWATVSYATQAVSQVYTLRVPGSAEANAVRTQNWTWATAALGAYSQSPLGQTTTAASELVGLTNSQTISGAKKFTAAGTVLENSTLTNGTIRYVRVPYDSSSNYVGLVFDTTGYAVNLVSDSAGRPSLYEFDGGYGIAAPASYTPDAQNVLTGGIADNRYGRLSGLNTWSGTNVFGRITNSAIVNSSLNYASAISGTVTALTNGWYVTPLLTNGYQVGSAFWSQNGTDNNTLQIGRTATASGTSATAIGYAASGTKEESLALGVGSKATNDFSTALGRASQTTADSQIRIGSTAEIVSIPGGAAIGGNVLLGRDWGTFPASLANGVVVTNGTAASADPSNGLATWVASGEWEYRTSASNEGSGGLNRVHNRGAVVVGSGTDFAVTGTAFARVDFSGQDPEVALPSAGTYLVWAEVALREDGVSANDDWSVKLYNSTDAADVANTVRSLGGLPVSEAGQLRIQTIVTVSAGKTLQVYAKNASGARGQVAAAETVIGYVRLY